MTQAWRWQLHTCPLETRFQESLGPLQLMHLVFGLFLQPPPLVQGLGGCSPCSWPCALLFLLSLGHLEPGLVVVFTALFVALFSLAQVGLCLLQLPLCTMPGFFDLLPASLMLQPPQGQGLREAGADRECRVGRRCPQPAGHLTSGAAHLHEGLGLQRAHCLHHAVAKLQILFQGQ